MGSAVTEDYATCDVLLIGRVTYDSFAGAWPDRESAGGEDAPLAVQLGDLRKVVVTREPRTFSGATPRRVTWCAVTAEVRSGKGIPIPGSISVRRRALAAACRQLRLLVHLVAARHGRRLFDVGDAPYHLTLTSAEVFPTGVIRVIYSPTQSSPGQVGYDEVKEHLDGA
jgi:dihydrofolate reductase